jgi:hypothetical protein
MSFLMVSYSYIVYMEGESQNESQDESQGESQGENKSENVGHSETDNRNARLQLLKETSDAL